ncbi:molybdopterin-dependent oxidoreductase [Teichococcus coralli]|uniref:molybdopterin-dependent oxidoreductase n=1 Tax=Teichococcus coralli TaxID=2545983 RepID=UPI0019263188
MSKRMLGRYTVGALLTGLAARATAAAELAAPVEKPILTISGKISAHNKGDSAQFDRGMLEALGMVGFETSTPWYPKPVRFDGIRMDRLMETVGASGDRVLAYALNDYSTELPVEDFSKYGVLLALKRNGEYMPVRDKGPLFIIYPFDSDPELRHQRFYSRSAWQLARLVVS